VGKVYNIADTQTVGHGAAVAYYGPKGGGEALHLGEWEQATLALDLDVGDGSESVVITVEGKADANGDWFTMPFHDLAAAADQWVQATSKTLTADATKALCLVTVWVPYLRVGVDNNGANDCLVTAHLITQ